MCVRLYEPITKLVMHYKYFSRNKRKLVTSLEMRACNAAVRRTEATWQLALCGLVRHLFGYVCKQTQLLLCGGRAYLACLVVGRVVLVCIKLLARPQIENTDHNWVPGYT